MKTAILVLLSACLLIFSFPVFDFGFLAWIALIPLFLALGGKRPKEAFLISFLTGIAFLMGVFYWINYIKGVTPVDFLLLGIYLGSYYGVFGFLLNIVARRPGPLRLLAAPALWVSLEYLRSHAGFLAIPWALLGHTQYRYLSVIQIASYTGVYGISFLLVMMNVSLADLISAVVQREEKASPPFKNYLMKVGIYPAVLAMLTVGYGLRFQKEAWSPEKVSVSVIQGNIPQNIKWDPAFLKSNIEKHVKLTEDAANRDHAQLIVWPESSFPAFLRHDLYFSRAIHNLSVKTQSHLLVGSSQRSKIGAISFNENLSHNSVYLFSSEGTVLDRYDKIRLLPFGEYLPGKDILPWPSRIVASAGRSIPGHRYTVFRMNDFFFGVLICWESLFPELARQFVKEGGQFLVNISNEAWFGETAAPYQFLSMNVFRAVENRVCLIRSVNTGISCFIAPTGKIVGMVKRGDKDIFIEGYLTKDVSLARGKTFYTLYGDLFAYGNLIMAISLVLIIWRGKQKNTGFETSSEAERDGP